MDSGAASFHLLLFFTIQPLSHMSFPMDPWYTLASEPLYSAYNDTFYTLYSSPNGILFIGVYVLQLYIPIKI
jgi:hypothetical protein